MKYLAMGIALAACAACSGPTQTGAVENDRSPLIADRVAMLDRAKASGFHIEKFDCPARTVSDETAETMLLMWVNNRTDLVDQSRLRTVSDDMISAFEKCGADMDSVINEMKSSDDTLMKGLSVAILQSGRGLS